MNIRAGISRLGVAGLLVIGLLRVALAGVGGHSVRVRRLLGIARLLRRGCHAISVGDAPCLRRRATPPSRGTTASLRRGTSRGATPRRRRWTTRSPPRGSAPSRGRTLGPQAARVSGQRVHQRFDIRRFRLHIDPQAELPCGLGGVRSEAGHDRTGMRLARDPHQVAHRRGGGEADRIEPTGLDLLADGRRWRSGAHRPVGGDIVDLPAAARGVRRPASRLRCRRGVTGSGRPGRARRRSPGTRPTAPRRTPDARRRSRARFRAP